jgi:hypothetical protein
MAIYRKDEQGRLIKTAGNLVQRWNDRIFLTEHSVVGDRDYYDIETAANKFITGLTDYTEFQLYIAEPNETSNVYIRFAGKELKLTRSDEDDIAIGYLFRRMTFYTLDTNSGIIWMDALLQPTPDTYRGIFTYALQTWDANMIPEPKIGETAIVLDTNNTYEYDGTSWDLTGTIEDQLNGWYWMIEFFPDYFFGSGKIVWNGGSKSWNVYRVVDNDLAGISAALEAILGV